MTAVEYLVEHLTPINWTKEYMKEHYTDIIKEAKKMEKQQIIKAFEEGMFHHINGMCPDEYYNEKFKIDKK